MCRWQNTCGPMSLASHTTMMDGTFPKAKSKTKIIDQLKKAHRRHSCQLRYYCRCSGAKVCHNFDVPPEPQNLQNYITLTLQWIAHWDHRLLHDRVASERLKLENQTLCERFCLTVVGCLSSTKTKLSVFVSYILVLIIGKDYYLLAAKKKTQT